MSNDSITKAGRAPAHVKPEQVVDFDIYIDPAIFRDPHLAYRELQKSHPDVFYTTANGGHWIVARYDLMYDILRDTDHFSNRELDIPPSNSPNLMIPLNLDPPDHTGYRVTLMRSFDRKAVAHMEPRLREWANRLIDSVIADGACDFGEALGAAFPVSVFMELMGLPLDRFEEFRAIVLEYFGKTTTERRIEIQNHMIAIMTEQFEDRRSNPRDDLMTRLVQDEIKGRKLTMQELQSIGFLLFIAGLDTVANALTFAFRHLALDQDLQKRLAAEPQKIPDFVEESLRRYAVVNQTRIVKKDFDFAGASFRTGDMVLCPLTMAGMDERKNPDPERFDIDRPDREHLTFSAGPHLCVGNMLARAEMRIFTEEWLKRIPECRVAANTTFEWRPSLVFGLKELPLEWERPAA